MRRLRTALLWLIAFNVVARAGALVVQRLVGERADAEGDEFDLLVLVNGREFESRARQLRRGRVRVLMGGASIDLREADLSPEGAGLEVWVGLGGVRLLVRPDWRVEVEGGLSGGKVTVRGPDHTGLPDSAPVLRVHVGGRAGGVVVGAEGRPDRVVRQLADV